MNESRQRKPNKPSHIRSYSDSNIPVTPPRLCRPPPGLKKQASLQSVLNNRQPKNRWIPNALKENNSGAVIDKNFMESILDTETYERFFELCQQMCSIDISSYETLNMIIHNIYEKVISEPSLCDLFADMCIQLSKNVNSSSFIHVLPVNVNGVQAFRWSIVVNSEIEDIIGPFESSLDCFKFAFKSIDRKYVTIKPKRREGREMKLVTYRVVDDTFLKVLKYNEKEYYIVLIPLSRLKEFGHQFSKEIFYNEKDCELAAAKHASVKRILLNICQGEFNKKDIYVDWKKQREGYDEIKNDLSEEERNFKEDEFTLQKSKVKSRMMTSIKFLGKLYIKCFLRELFIHYCVRSLFKWNIHDNDINDANNDKWNEEMEEEHHEALYHLLMIIGRTIDMNGDHGQMNIYFQKIMEFSTNETLSTRIRDMYRNLIRLRNNQWSSYEVQNVSDRQVTCKSINFSAG